MIKNVIHYIIRRNYLPGEDLTNGNKRNYLPGEDLTNGNKR
jgi:hypothetical protein